MDERFVKVAAAMSEEGRSLTLTALAREVGVSRSTAYRRTGGVVAVREALAARGVDAEAQTTRGRLLTATRALVATQGVVNATIENIAGYGNISPVSVYRIFGDRETLLREAFRDVFPVAVLTEEELEAHSIEQALMLIAEGVVRFAGTYPGLMALMLLPASIERAELMAVHRVQQDLRDRVVTLFDHYVTTKALPAGDVPSRATAFLGLCLGASLLMHELRPLDEQDVKPRARQVVRGFLMSVGITQGDDDRNTRRNP